MFNAIKTALNDHHDHQLHDVQAPPAVSSSTAYAGEPVPQPQVEASPAAPTCAAEPPPIPQPTRSVAAQSLDLPLAHLAQLGAGCGSWNICKVGHGISSAACNARVESCGGEEVFTVVYPKDSFKPQGVLISDVGMTLCVVFIQSPIYYKVRFTAYLELVVMEISNFITKTHAYNQNIFKQNLSTMN